MRHCAHVSNTIIGFWVHPTAGIAVCSISTEKGILGIQETKQMMVKMPKTRKMIPPLQYLRESM